MKILCADVAPYTLSLEKPLRTANGLWLRRQGCLFRLQAAKPQQDPLWGFGDAAAFVGFGSAAQVVTEQEALQAIIKQLHRYSQQCQGQSIAWQSPEEVADFVASLSLLPEAAYAVESAYLDILAQSQQLSLAALLQPACAKEVAVHRLVDSAVQAQDAKAQGFGCLKIKLGYAPLDDDILRVLATRAAVGPQLLLRLDANGQWSYEEACKALNLLSAALPCLLEQPVAKEAREALAALRQRQILPIVADESVSDSQSLKQLLACEAVDGVVIKPMVMGGVYSSFQACQLALQVNQDVCITHLFESAIGRLVALQLAAALPKPQENKGSFHGLSSYLLDDLAPYPEAVLGKLSLPTDSGIGLSPLARKACLRLSAFQENTAP